MQRKRIVVAMLVMALAISAGPASAAPASRRVDFDPIGALVRLSKKIVRAMDGVIQPRPDDPPPPPPPTTT